jgi:magnesium transporter
MTTAPDTSAPTAQDTPSSAGALAEALHRRQVPEAVNLAADMEAVSVVDALSTSNPAVATDVLVAMGDAARERILAAAPEELSLQWRVNALFDEGSVGRLMEPARAIFRPETHVAQAVEELRSLVQRAFITYGWVVDDRGCLVGLLVFRELLFAGPAQRLEEIMLRQPYSLRPETPLPEAMRDVVARHYPVYPVTDAAGRLLGVVRGQAMFEEQVLDLSAQPGEMVGVGAGERLGTPWRRSLLARHPWLQLNLLTAFVAAAVVGLFSATIDRIVLLAAFLPVLAGQSGNTGCQALAVTLRGMTLGEMTPARSRAAVAKESLLGLCNGLLVGVTAGAAMYAYALTQGSDQALTLAAVVVVAMTFACIVSGVSGALIPLALERVGADPATASSIFLTTATDVVSMGMFLGLATVLVPS